MQKICQECLEVYNGTELISFCPKRGCCGDSELVEIDDMLVDIIINFWTIGVQTIFSCAGHIYDRESFPFQPYITFFAFQFDGDEHSSVNEENLNDLIMLHEILNKIDKKNEFDIGEIEPSTTGDGYECALNYKISEVGNLSSRDKLRIQYKFLSFLYDVISFIEHEGR